MRPRYLFAFALLHAAVAAPQETGEPRQPDVVSYVARVAPDFGTLSVSGNVKIRVVARSGSTASFAFDAGDLAIDAVRENGAPLPFEKRARQLVVTLPRAAAPSDAREIEIDYHGTPRRGLLFAADAEQVSTAFATSDWLPCVDAPSERATLDLTVVVPAGLTVAASGYAAGQSGAGTDRVASRWRLDRPVPCYLYGFAAGRFSEVTEQAGNVELRYLGPQALSDAELREVFAATADMLEFFAAKSGLDYPGAAYTQVLLRNGSGQELAALSVFGERYGQGVLVDPRDVWLGAHEAAHQWWGNSVTNESWTEFWLNEGVGTFMTAAYLEHRFGRDEYLRQIGAAKAKYEALRAAGHDRSLVFASWSAPTREDRSLVYDKGAYVMHLLREELGEESFWAGIASYTRDHWGESVTTRDLQLAMERASRRDLTEFFARWVYLR